MYHCSHFSPNPLYIHINSLPNNIILDLPKFKAFADNNSYVAMMMKIVLNRVGNTVTKKVNVGHQHILLFLLCFQKSFSSVA